MPPTTPRLTPRLLATTAVLALSLAACGGGGTTAQPSTSASPSAPSPTPTLPTVAADKAATKAALLTAAELGKPWVQPKSVNKVKAAKGELCPGQPTSAVIAKARAEARRQFTEGTKTGAGILSVNVRTYAFGKEDAWRAAVDKANKACAKWKAVEGNYVVLEPVAAAPSVAGAEEVVGHYERVYADAAHKTLQYVRQILEARTGRVVVTMEYAFLTPKSDPNGDDLTKTTGYLAKQVSKAARLSD
jgi:hypothetical protein